MSTGTGTGQRRRRRLQLTPMRSIPVEFTGERAREGPLTLGQLNVCAWVSGTVDDLYAILPAEPRYRGWCLSMTWPGRPLRPR